VAVMRAALLAPIAAGLPLSVAVARGGYTPRPTLPCGWSGGALDDPAVTQACLARRYVKPVKAPPPAPAAAPAEQPPAPAHS
jgi:hypothetical protein